MNTVDLNLNLTQKDRRYLPVETYAEALQFMDALDVSAMKLGLSRIRRVLDLLENPQDDLAVVHIGGTNGKGSVSAMLTRIYLAAGYGVGTFVSPHLSDIRERIVLDGEWISQEDFVRELESLRQALCRFELDADDWPTYFEFLNILAFRYFHRQGVELVFMEVGLGGRLDSTNVLKKPLLSVITSISLDHQERLGNSIKEIAGEKAGIIKPLVPLVLGPRFSDEAFDVFTQKSQELSAPLNQAKVERCQLIETKKKDDKSPKAQLFWDSGREIELALPLLGQYQQENLTTVLTVLDELNIQGFEVSKEATRVGLRQVVWPARFEFFPEHSLLLDGGHNEAGFQVLGQSLRHHFKEAPLFWLISLRSNRPLEALVSMIASFENTQAVYCVSGPQAHLYYSPEDLADAFKKAFEETGKALIPDIRCFDESVLAFEELQRVLAFEKEGEPEALGVICGSLYTAGELRRLISLD